MTKNSPPPPPFADKFSAHVMDLRLDQGVYRHLVFTKNRSTIARFEIVTWPGYLVVCGDMGSYTFSRLRDMFEFFRGRDINPGYWSEKLVATDRDDGHRAYDPDLFRSVIRDVFDETDPAHRGDWSDVEDLVLVHADDGVDLALSAAMSFPAGMFSDVYEYGLWRWTERYLWLLRALVHGIAVYDRAKEVENGQGEGTVGH